jgi:hypothetical protein
MRAGLQVGHTQLAILARSLQPNALRQPRLQLSISGLDFTPADLAVAVSVQVQCQVQVAQVDVGAQHQLLGGRAQAQVAVAA